jgi:hypothetical protein
VLVKDVGSLQYDGVVLQYDGVTLQYDGVTLQYDGVVLQYDGDALQYDVGSLVYDGGTLVRYATAGRSRSCAARPKQRVNWCAGGGALGGLLYLHAQNL